MKPQNMHQIFPSKKIQPNRYTDLSSIITLCLVQVLVEH